MAAKPFIPTEVAEVSPAWVTQVMQEAGVLTADQAVIGVQLQVLEGGTGFQGVASRIVLTYSPGATGPATVVAKFPTKDGFNRAMAESMRGYEREILFYRGLASEVPVRTPIHYGSAMDKGPSKKTVSRTLGAVDRLPKKIQVKLASDPEKMSKPSKRRFALLIEDLGDVTVYDASNPPNEQQVRKMLSLLAQLHAHFWGRTDLVDHEATDGAGSTIPRLQANMWDVTGAPVSVPHFEGDLSQEALDLLATCGDTFVEDVAHINRPITLGHGDVRSDNWLWSADGEVALVDWAMPVLADPGFDVGYLIVACGDRSRAREQAKDLASHYLGELSKNGVDYPEEDLWESIEAMARVQAVLHSFGLSYTDLSYGEKSLGEWWIPTALGILLGSA